MSKRAGKVGPSFTPPKAAKLPPAKVAPLVQPRTTSQRDASAVQAKQSSARVSGSK